MEPAGGIDQAQVAAAEADDMAASIMLGQSNRFASRGFSDKKRNRTGIHTNGAESYFARMRRMIRGQHHRVGPAYLKGYVAHAAWLEDLRKASSLIGSS